MSKPTILKKNSKAENNEENHNTTSLEDLDAEDDNRKTTSTSTGSESTSPVAGSSQTSKGLSKPGTRGKEEEAETSSESYEYYYDDEDDKDDDQEPGKRKSRRSTKMSCTGSRTSSRLSARPSRATEESRRPLSARQTNVDKTLEDEEALLQRGGSSYAKNSQKQSQTTWRDSKRASRASSRTTRSSSRWDEDDDYDEPRASKVRNVSRASRATQTGASYSERPSALKRDEDDDYDEPRASKVRNVSRASRATQSGASYSERPSALKRSRKPGSHFAEESRRRSSANRRSQVRDDSYDDEPCRLSYGGRQSYRASGRSMSRASSRPQYCTNVFDEERGPCGGPRQSSSRGRSCIDDDFDDYGANESRSRETISSNQGSAGGCLSYPMKPPAQTSCTGALPYEPPPKLPPPPQMNPCVNQCTGAAPQPLPPAYLQPPPQTMYPTRCTIGTQTDKLTQPQKADQSPTYFRQASGCQTDQPAAPTPKSPCSASRQSRLSSCGRSSSASVDRASQPSASMSRPSGVSFCSPVQSSPCLARAPSMSMPPSMSRSSTQSFCQSSGPESLPMSRPSSASVRPSSASVRVGSGSRASVRRSSSKRGSRTSRTSLRGARRDSKRASRRSTIASSENYCCMCPRSETHLPSMCGSKSGSTLRDNQSVNSICPRTTCGAYSNQSRSVMGSTSRQSATQTQMPPPERLSYLNTSNCS